DERNVAPSLDGVALRTFAEVVRASAAPGRRPACACDQREQRGLAAAVPADHTPVLAGSESPRDAVQDRRAVDVDVDAVELDQCGASVVHEEFGMRRYLIINHAVANPVAITGARTELRVRVHPAARTAIIAATS